MRIMKRRSLWSNIKYRGVKQSRIVTSRIFFNYFQANRTFLRQLLFFFFVWILLIQRVVLIRNSRRSTATCHTHTCSVHWFPTYKSIVFSKWFWTALWMYNEHQLRTLYAEDDDGAMTKKKVAHTARHMDGWDEGRLSNKS